MRPDVRPAACATVAVQDFLQPLRIPENFNLSGEVLVDVGEKSRTKRCCPVQPSRQITEDLG